jgi:hypothetical protein
MQNARRVPSTTPVAYSPSKPTELTPVAVRPILAGHQFVRFDPDHPLRLLVERADLIAPDYALGPESEGGNYGFRVRPRIG